MSVTDAFGESIEVGDWVGYLSGGKWPTMLKGQVVEVRKQVKVRVTQKVSGFVRDETHWCVPHRLVKTLETFEVDVTEPKNVVIHIDPVLNQDDIRSLVAQVHYNNPSLRKV